MNSPDNGETQEQGGINMKATEAKLFPFLKKSPQFAIPIYQRTYSWTEAECQQLWDDILRAGTDEDVPAHFLGSIVYIETSLYQVTNQSPLLVIDGQQRLTTVCLIIEALARRLGDVMEPIDGFSAKKLRSYYLLNPLEDGERRYKLLLTQTDKKTLLAIVDQKPLPSDHSLRLVQNFEFFEDRIRNIDSKLKPLCEGLAKLMVVDISLTRDQDNPQLIFESMNSTGRELSQADLVRNFILMGLKPEHQTRLYNDHWRPMEVTFGQKAYGQHFDSFMRHYLTLKTDEIPRVAEVYSAFKAHARDPQVAANGIDALVADVRSFANYYCAMALGQESDVVLAAAFADLRELKVDVAYPLLLELYHDYVRDLLSKQELNQIVRLVESYVFRRSVCAIPTNSLNKTFATFGRELRKGRYLESIQAHFLLLPSYRRFPGDEEFRRELKVRDLYNFRSRSYWLRRLENYDRKERVSVDEYTIEHIMPQNENLSTEWLEELGEEWRRVQETYLHTLGNLTLTGYNVEYSDRPFAEKRDMNGGFRESPLRVNKGLRAMEYWNESAIQSRADRLAHKAIEVWPAPKLADDVLLHYSINVRLLEEDYTIHDHDQLAVGTTSRALFDKFRKEVMALDPCITEEFRKVYVAYKAETNFVDVVPQAKRLRLMLNLQFHDLQDPRGLAKDVTNLGHWGNGDVAITLNTPDEVPYVVGLVRQALENQMGNDGN